MNCEGFDRRLDALLDGACSADEWREAEAHLRGCARCGRLFEAALGRAGGLDEAGHAQLTDSIIAATSGGACAAARDRLGDLADGLLDPFDRELVDAHLTRCRSCAEVAGAVARSARVLPSFAEMEPPSFFATRVFAATSRRPPQPALGERLAAWLARLARRPRFSLEVAYACTLVLLLILGDPVKAFREASTRVQPRVQAAARVIGGPLSRARTAGAETLAEVTSMPALKAAPGARPSRPSLLLEGEDAIRRWWQANIAGPVRAMAAQAWTWATGIVDSATRLLHAAPREPARPTEPGDRPARSFQ